MFAHSVASLIMHKNTISSYFSTRIFRNNFLKKGENLQNNLTLVQNCVIVLSSLSRS